MTAYSPVAPGKSRFPQITRRFIYWACGAALLTIMIIVGLVCGLVFGLHHVHASSSSTAPLSTANISLDVDLGYSHYQGSNGAPGVSQWLGIRYAAAPVGDLRFKAPQDPVFDGKKYIANTVSSLLHIFSTLTFDSTALYAISVHRLA